jgi:DNA helicase-2/ATP-dependent DNA helicase PcrA
MALSKEKLRTRFLDEYARLNDQQKTAVDTIEGPVMVIAGPGTGKTQILASRIGNILLNTDASPQNILCLTFTDAGVVAMRKRLLSFIGPEAYKVNIHTFHSFCNMVIQENIRYFNKRELEALSDLERVEFIKKLIDGFPKDNPLKRNKGEVYHDLNNLSSLFSAIKREGWDISWLIEQIKIYTAEILPDTEGFYKKREKAKGITELTQKGKDEVERMTKLEAAVAAFKTYTDILDNKQRYDFDDMINWVIELFEKNNEVLLSYQEQFQYILVDEYQDTSGSQNRIVELLISYWEDEKPNIFVVGDDDQSIYRFQGANLKNMMNIADKYERDLVKVVLTQNYRSVQPILDAAKNLITNNTQRLVNQYKDLSKELIASNAKLKPLEINPVIRVYENEFAENVAVAENIKALLDKGVEGGKIGVIYREHKYGDELLKFFQLQDIPFFIKRSVDLLQDHFIKQIIQLMRYTVAELDTPFSGEAMLFEILHYKFFNLPPFKIAAICNEIGSSKNKSIDKNTLRGYLRQQATQNSGTLFSNDETTDELVRVSNVLEKLQEEVYNVTLQQWFEKLINDCGILKFVLADAEKVWLMQKLTCFFDHIKESTHRDPELTLKKYVEQIDLMAQNGLPLSLVQTTGSEAGVNLMSAHGSKGLEFEYVFLIGARTDVWEGKTKNNRGFRLPPNVFEQESAVEKLEELRRLFFVAVTRAEKYLYISYPLMKNEGKPLEPSQFVEEIREPMQLTAEKIILDEDIRMKYSALRFGIVQRPLLEKVEQDFINRLLQNFVMNVTALNNYLDCPLRFYYNTLVKVPMAKNEAAQFGTAVHAALNDFLIRMKENNNIYPGKEFLLQRFSYHLNKGRDAFTQESIQRFSIHGLDTLDKYYDKYYDPAPVNDFILTEYPLSNVVIENIQLKGFTDKIQFWNNDIVITDYKTGNLAKAKMRGDFDLPGSEKKPQGGNYWRQAVFYKILVDRLPSKKWNVLYTQFDFVEPNAKNDFDIERIDILPEHELAVIDQIKDTWHKIQDHDFYTGCGKETCEWCNFTKDNKLYTKLIEEEE